MLEPFATFDKWFKEAQSCGISEANAMALSTTNKAGQPSTRYVLLKEYDERGFIFYTNLYSRKAKDIAQNPQISCTFYWPATKKQIRIEGKAKQVPDVQADQYFATRPYDSQISAWASEQSSVLSNEEDFEARIRGYQQQWEGKVITRPPFWSGFKITPDKIEFWQEGQFRRHKRMLYIMSGTNWDVTMLYP